MIRTSRDFNARKRVAAIFGTRPEAVKMAPVISALSADDSQFVPTVLVTAQHREMLDQVLSVFDIRPDYDLNIMQANQTLNGMSAKILAIMQETLSRPDIRPDIVLVQGDTTTAFIAALAAFNLRIPTAHIEAGLRSHDLDNPFPEEGNRRLVGVLSTLHFAPTALARDNLIAEGVAADKVIVTGNTVVDAVNALVNVPFDLDSSPLRGIPFDQRRVVLVTSHRRESWGQELANICLAVKDLATRFPDVQIVFPVHMNPAVRQTVFDILDSHPNISLTAPLDYLTFLNLMKRSSLILTDSGGIQEEAPTLGVPLLVLRKLTERPEAFHAGLAKVVGTDRDAIVAEASKLLSDRAEYLRMVSTTNPYGDGKAARRIVQALNAWSFGEMPTLRPDAQFNVRSHIDHNVQLPPASAHA